MRSPSKKTPAKPYKKPTLRVYGSIESVTATVGAVTMNSDGGSGGTMTKTH